VVLHGIFRLPGLRPNASGADRLCSGQAQTDSGFDRYTWICAGLRDQACRCFLAVGWDLVKEIYKEHLSRKLKARKLGEVRYSPWTSSPSARGMTT